MAAIGKGGLGLPGTETNDREGTPGAASPEARRARSINPEKMEEPRQTLGPRKNKGEGVWRKTETRERRGSGVRQRKEGGDDDREKTREQVESETGLRKLERDGIIHAFLPSFILCLLSTFSVPLNFPGDQLGHGIK